MKKLETKVNHISAPTPEDIFRTLAFVKAMPKDTQEKLLELAIPTTVESGDTLQTNYSGEMGFHVVVSGIARLEGKGTSGHRGPGTVIGLVASLLGRSLDRAHAETLVHTYFIKDKDATRFMEECEDMAANLWHLAGMQYTTWAVGNVPPFNSWGQERLARYESSLLPSCLCSVAQTLGGDPAICLLSELWAGDGGSGRVLL